MDISRVGPLDGSSVFKLQAFSAWKLKWGGDISAFSFPSKVPCSSPIGESLRKDADMSVTSVLLLFGFLSIPAEERCVFLAGESS